MSAIGGIFSRHGAAFDDGALERLSQGLEQIGPDGEAFYRDHRVAMVHRPFHVGAESRQDQPWVDGDGLVVCWNGRLDNAPELLRALDLSTAEATIPELVAAAYRQHGRRCVEQLIGDFSLALWDPQRQRLLLATDPFALRPLFFHQNAEVLWWSSRARPLLRAAGLSTALDEVGVAAFLTFIDSADRTVLRDVRMVPPAHRLIAEGGEVTLESYWSPVPQVPLQHTCDADYEAHFAQVFQRAVADRLMADAPVWADLSGGLDSSSIVCVGDRVLASEKGGRQPGMTSTLHTVSYVYDRSRSCDEREYLQAVERQRGCRGLYIHDTEVPTLAPIPSSLVADLPSGQLPFHNRYQFQHQAMAAIGSRVLLRGSGGDHVLWGEALAAFELADLLVAGRPRELWRRAQRWARQRREPVVKTLWQGAVWPLLPRTMRAATGFVHPLDGWLDADFVSRVDLHDRLLGEPDRRFTVPSQRLQWALIAGVGRYVGWELPLASGCVESRYPFLDRRLVELAMAMPTEQKLRPGETRSVLRRAFRGVLPEKVRTRTSKAGPDEAIYRALTREAAWLSELFTDARICQHGFVQADALKLAVAQARHGVMLSSPQLMRAITLESWLRSLEHDVQPGPAAREVALPIPDARCGRGEAVSELDSWRRGTQPVAGL